MEKNKIGFGIALGIALASLPVWRSGEKKGLNLFEFIGEHTVFANTRQWVQLKDKNTNDDVYVSWLKMSQRIDCSILMRAGDTKENSSLIFSLTFLPS